MSFISYAQNFEDVMLWRALKHVEKGCYVDVGAQHPAIDSVSRAFYERGWRGVHIEPVPQYADLLRENRPDETVLQIALSDKDGRMELNVIPDTGLSTGIDAYADRHQKEHGFECRRIEVPVLTLKSALPSLAGKDVHWLKIDVEGFEEHVLKGWDSQSLRPWIMVVEATIPNSRETNHASWEPILTAAGYQFVYFDGLNRFYVADEHAELVEAFSCPPNTFDDMEITAHSHFCRKLMGVISPDDREFAVQAQWLQNEWDHAKARVEELVDDTLHWQAKAANINQELQSVYASTSWRITAPLRKIIMTARWILSRFTGHMRQVFPLFKRIARTLAVWALRKTIARPRLKTWALTVLARYPRLKTRLRALALRSKLIEDRNSPPPASRPVLCVNNGPPSRAARLHASIQKAVRLRHS
jgi:FkbM family methyltransferase